MSPNILQSTYMHHTKFQQRQISKVKCKDNVVPLSSMLAVMLKAVELTYFSQLSDWLEK